MRKFKLKNGMVVEESKLDGYIELNGYIDDYVVVEPANSAKKAGDRITLLLAIPGSYPTGGAFGAGYDIIKQVEA